MILRLHHPIKGRYSWEKFSGFCWCWAAQRVRDTRPLKPQTPIRQSDNLVPEKLWSRGAGREMEIKEGEPVAGQTSSNATAEEWQREKREYESYTNPSPYLRHPLPAPPHPSCLQCLCSRVTSILTHSFTAESQVYFCYTDVIVLLKSATL